MKTNTERTESLYAMSPDEAEEKAVEFWGGEWRADDYPAYPHGSQAAAYYTVREVT